LARIVVIDDSRMMRTVLRRILEKGGHEVTEWEPMSAAEIMEQVTAVNPDLLITDYQMPGANGATVVKMARKAKPGIKVIAFTALRDEEVVALLGRVEADAVLTKPAHEESLLDAVKTILER
jgi:CheY-like chemotaxis protein